MNLLIILGVLMAAGGAGYYFFFMKNKPADGDVASEASEPEAPTTSEPSEQGHRQPYFYLNCSNLLPRGAVISIACPRRMLRLPNYTLGLAVFQPFRAPSRTSLNASFTALRTKAYGARRELPAPLWRQQSLIGCPIRWR